MTRRSLSLTVALFAAAPALRRRDPRLGHDRPDPRRGLPPLAGDGDGRAAHRRARAAAQRLAAVQAGRGVGAPAAPDLGPPRRSPRAVRVRPRLELRAQLGPRGRAGDVPAGGDPEGLDRGHERPRARQGGARQGRVRGGRREVEGQARGPRGLGRRAARAQVARGPRRLPALQRAGARRARASTSCRDRAAARLGGRAAVRPRGVPGAGAG